MRGGYQVNLPGISPCYLSRSVATGAKTCFFLDFKQILNRFAIQTHILGGCTRVPRLAVPQGYGYLTVTTS